MLRCVEVLVFHHHEEFLSVQKSLGSTIVGPRGSTWPTSGRVRCLCPASGTSFGRWLW